MLRFRVTQQLFDVLLECDLKTFCFELLKLVSSQIL